MYTDYYYYCDKKEQTITSLPAEVLAEVFSFLDKPSKLNCRLVSEKWRSVLDMIFFGFHGVLTDKSFPRLRGSASSSSSSTASAVGFSTLTIKEFLMKVPPEAGTSLSRSKLAFHPTNLVFKQRGSDTRAPYEASVSSENMTKMILYNKNVKSLKFGKNSLQGIESLKVEGLLMQHLEHLEVKLMEELSQQEDGVLLQLARIKKPALKDLVLKSTKFAIISNERDTFIHYINLFNFLAAHKSTIKHLELKNFYPMVLRVQNIQANAPYSPLIRTLLKQIKEDLNEIKLTTLKFLFPRQEGTFPYSLGFHLLAQQDRLTALEVNIPFCGDLSSLYEQVCGTLERNLKTLKFFTIHRYIVKPKIDEIRSVLAILSKSTQLNSLQLFLYTIPTFFYKLPGTLTQLTVLGNLSPSLLSEIKDSLPKLEFLYFSNLSAVTREVKAELRDLLKLVLKMPAIRYVKWYTEGFDMDFLAAEPGLSIQRVNNNLFIFLIKVLR